MSSAVEYTIDYPLRKDWKKIHQLEGKVFLTALEIAILAALQFYTLRLARSSKPLKKGSISRVSGAGGSFSLPAAPLLTSYFKTSRVTEGSLRRCYRFFKAVALTAVICSGAFAYNFLHIQ
jgi:hypothetical protein